MTDEQTPTPHPAPQEPDQNRHPMAAPPPPAAPGYHYPPPPPHGYPYDPRARVKAPAVGLVIAGLLSIISLTFVFVAPQIIDSFITLIEQRGSLLPQEDLQLLRAQLEKASDLSSLSNILSIAATFIGGFITTVAGFSMMRLQKWNLCLLGSILSIVPFTACCCTGAPLGIWALIVLAKHEVKASFRHSV